MGVFAVVFGLLAVFVAQTWLNRQAEMRARNMEAPKAAVATRTVLVAAQPLRYGMQLGPQHVREVAWPEGAIPSGVFTNVGELTSEGKRIVLAAIEPNEPILASKVTGPGQRATLSAIIQPGLRAITVRVNDVEGVAGFVLPGDHVDVLLTRMADDKTASTTDVVLQQARVLAVDQLADDSADKPTVARAVTLEVDIVAAQKISLAASVGSLSLSLRKAGETLAEGTRRVTLADLSNPEIAGAAREPKPFATVSVTRATKKQDYSVPAESQFQLASQSARGGVRLGR